MNLTEIKKSLERQFARELSQGSVRNIVFWYDEEGVFAEDIDSLALEGVKIIKLYDNNMFAVKLYIEETDTTGNLLVYSPLPRPANRENWLTDTIKYSQTFSSDETSLNLLNFKIDSALRHVVERYKLFFRNSERCRRFEGYHLAPYTEAKIDVGVLSALCKLPAPNLDNVVRTLLIELANGESTVYDSITKFGNMDALWALIQKSYGYNFPEQSLEKLAILLLCTHLAHSINGNLPKEWQTYVSANSNCFVFVDNFMKNSQLWEAYNKLAGFVADRLNLSARTSKWSIDEIVDCDTFEEFDRSIISRLCENISQGVGEYERYRKVIHSRKNRRYYPQFEIEYDVLLYACEYLELAQKHADLSGLTVAKLFDEYTKTFYKLDSSYRHFLLGYDKLAERDGFGPLFEKVENSYTNWYLNGLSMKWCALWDDERAWQVPGVTSQQGFYDKYVRRFVADNERLIVVVSDGLRYESAVELRAILNREQKGSSQLEVMLGVIPSYTALGMASLLPHKNISITDKADIEIDGISTKGTDNRGKILKLVKEESVVTTYDHVMGMTKQKMVEKFSGVKLIYIYHNTIDARGDNAATEHEVFDATEKCFRELSGLVRALRNNISAINILITADHGYIYRRTPLAESDKTPKEDAAAIETKRRFILTKENIDMQGTQVFSMDYLTKDKTDIRAVIPRATNCFKIQGAGSCYVHGGTNLQEVVIPVIRFKSDKNLHRSMGAKKVSLGLTNLSRKITSVITHLTFFQNEPVGEKLLPLRVTAYFADEAGNRISNENIIIAESTSDKPDERTYKEKFTLKDMPYDKSKKYYLVLKDEDEIVNSEYLRIPFIIDLVFGGSIQF
ncbi:MAG: BREX-1 system phosphatase PglZ type A [Bacillota bacterium]